ncbi:erythromycin esterase family protein [Pseudonocardia cypriaca]|uniref:Erythromycin esterase-like protein n=1 Tax=Pseudonocardia cypriaca TaxID=882449 RepID=A0A543FRK5_9PSEU|nr:erythromycin esterase family protein [Pseudonocardia cypriaca]TQM36462.1 erythromycin esterase-like protein [Pseudonocardia cypriaca]
MDDPADVRALARPLQSDSHLDPLVERAGDARLVLIGEASHGTHEYYAWRDRLTRRLVTEKGFGFVAVEGDWPDCRRLHRAVTGGPEDVDEALGGYDRWPTWMWANSAVRAAMNWLREHNAELPPQRRVGFHGLDVYSLQRSMREVVRWLREHDPDHASAALDAYACFEPYGPDPLAYARATRWVPENCEDAVIEVLRDMCERHGSDGSSPGEADQRFVAEQNAAVVAGAERYYRAAVRGGPDSWNVRDVHMADTLDRLLDHHGPGSKGVVWAHNTHIGDARATDMAAAGMTSLGQLAHERHADDGVVLVGFAGHRGDVVAASSWGAPAERLPVPPARDGSAEDLLHRALGDEPSLLVFPETYDQPRWLRTSFDHRAIGVVYHPDQERWGNYVPSTLGDRYDALLWFGETTALEPLRAEPADDPEPQTAPTGQ